MKNGELSRVALAYYKNGTMTFLDESGGVFHGEGMNQLQAEAAIDAICAAGNFGRFPYSPIAFNTDKVRRISADQTGRFSGQEMRFENKEGGLIYEGNIASFPEIRDLPQKNPLLLAVPNAAINMKMLGGVDYTSGKITFLDKLGQPIGEEVSADEKPAKALLDRWNDYKKMTGLKREIRKIDATKFELPPFLKHFAVNLNAEAAKGKINPLIGREREIERVESILHRERKGNPVLIGEAGVGKTAIAEGLALKIVEGDVPDCLRDKMIVSLQMNTMVAGTMLRGMFEDRIQNVIRELKERPNLILFIDELHTIVGAGSALGAPSDAANVLKTALADGTVRMIGATTLAEYDEHIKKDEALARRTQPVIIDEMGWEQTRTVARGHADRLGRHFGISVPDDVLERAMEFCEKIPGSSLADRVIDILDETLARLDIKEKSSITPEDIIDTIAVKFDKPRKLIGRSDEAILDDVAHSMEHVIGQKSAKAAFFAALKRDMAGLGDPDAPMGTFGFVGPSGVGKTELAETIADALGYNFVKLDMTRFTDPEYSLFNLIGSPRGIVGNEKAGELTGPVSDHPYSVVFADEIDKAAPAIQNIFMQAADKGEMQDSRSRKINFRNTILILAGNFDVRNKPTAAFLQQEKKEQAGKQKLSAEVGSFFSPATQGRMDIIEFDNLSEDEVSDIAVNFVTEREERVLKKRHIHIGIEMGDEERHALARLAHSNDTGARELDRVMKSQIDNLIADKIISGELKDGGRVRISLKLGDPKQRFAVEVFDGNNAAPVIRQTGTNLAPT